MTSAEKEKILYTISTFSAVKYEWWINERFNFGNFNLGLIYYISATSLIFNPNSFRFNPYIWFDVNVYDINVQHDINVQTNVDLESKFGIELGLKI